MVLLTQGCLDHIYHPHAWPHTTRAHKYMQTKGAAGYLSWRMSGERIAVHFVCIFLSILDEFNPLSSSLPPFYLYAKPDPKVKSRMKFNV